MSKILESLPLTIVAGIVLTIIMALATDAIVSSSMNHPAAGSLAAPQDPAAGL